MIASLTVVGTPPPPPPPPLQYAAHQQNQASAKIIRWWPRPHRHPYKMRGHFTRCRGVKARPDDRRVVLVLMTPEGDAALQASRAVHRDGIRRHFTEQLDGDDLVRLQAMLEKVRDHVRPLRPGRVSG